MYYDGFIVNVILLDESFGVQGSVHHNEDDSYTIFIDANLCYEKQIEVCEHELNHIKNGDLEKTDVNEIECKAYKCAM